MSQTLNSIAIDVVSQYGEAAKHLVDAYRIGSERTISGIGAGYPRLVEGRSLPLVTDELKTALVDTEKRMSNLAVGAINRAAERTQAVVERVMHRAVEGMEAFGHRTAWANEMFVVEAVRTINMPAAKFSLGIANRANQATALLSERVATFGKRMPKAGATQGVKAAAKRARRAVRKA